jgi:hypothetical protein
MRHCKNRFCNVGLSSLDGKKRFCVSCRYMSRRAWKQAGIIAGAVAGVLWFLFQIAEKVFHL